MRALLAGASLLAVAGTACLAGCVTAEPSSEVIAFFWGRGKEDLTTGTKRYEDGDYLSAKYFLKSALASGLRDNKDRVTAHKYLAFLHCSEGDIKLCHDEFTMVLAIYPDFRLAPGEASHPVWRIVFDDVKSGPDDDE